MVCALVTYWRQNYKIREIFGTEVEFLDVMAEKRMLDLRDFRAGQHSVLGNKFVELRDKNFDGLKVRVENMRTKKEMEALRVKDDSSESDEFC